MCAALILKRKLFLNKKLFYIPRGFVIDYQNEEILTTFVREIKKYAKKQNGICVKIDPFVCFNQDSIETIKKGKNVDIQKPFVENTEKLVKALEKKVLSMVDMKR